MNKKDNGARPPAGDLVSDDKSSVDSPLGHPPTELELYLVSDDTDDGPSNSPSPDSNIPSPSQPLPPNTYQERNVSLEGAQSELKRKY